MLAIFTAFSVVLVNAWIGAVAVSVVALVVIQIFGFMGAVGIRMSAIPAVMLVLAAGIGVQFTVHVCVVSTILGCESTSFNSLSSIVAVQLSQFNCCM